MASVRKARGFYAQQATASAPLQQQGETTTLSQVGIHPSNGTVHASPQASSSKNPSQAAQTKSTHTECVFLTLELFSSVTHSTTEYISTALCCTLGGKKDDHPSELEQYPVFGKSDILLIITIF